MLHGLVIDDHRLFAASLKFLLASEFNFEIFEICHDQSSIDEMITVNDERFDLILVDFYLPGYNAKMIIAELRKRSPDAKIICISASLSAQDERIAKNVGADLYLPKNTDPALLIAAIKSLLKGRPPIIPRQHDISDMLGLTSRQAEILQEMAKGRSNKEIACHLELSPETIKSHIADLYRQTGASNRIMLINWVRDRGFLVPY